MWFHALAMTLSPDAAHRSPANGWGEQGVQVLDRGTGRSFRRTPSILLSGLGSVPMVFAVRIRRNDDAVYAYKWSNGRAELAEHNHD